MIPPGIATLLTHLAIGAGIVSALTFLFVLALCRAAAAADRAIERDATARNDLAQWEAELADWDGAA